MGSPGYTRPSTSTFGQIRGPIVDTQGNILPVFQRYLSSLEAKTNQTLSVAGNTVLNNISTVAPGVVSPTTNTGAFHQFAEFSIDITTKGNPVLILFNAECFNFTALSGAQFILYVDGVASNTAISTIISPDVQSPETASISFLDSPLPGAHNYKIYWATILGGTAESPALRRSFQAIELG